MLGQSSNVYRAENPFGGGENDVSVGFGPAEDQIHPGGESDFGAIKGVKWQTPIFDGKTTYWRRFEMEFLMAMRHRCLNSVLAGG